VTNGTVGAVYEGNWKNNKMHGKGTMTHRNGIVYEGNWRDHRMIGKRSFLLIITDYSVNDKNCGLKNIFFFYSYNFATVL
jgi:hypothetical protein